MEGLISEEPNCTIKYEQIDLTLKLSPYGSVPAEGEKGLMRFGELQTMRRVRSGKRLVLEKQRRENELKLNMAWHNLGGASSNIQTSPKEAMLQEMTVRCSVSQLESPSKRLKHHVTTTGDGPSGKRIEGLLHKYKGGEVCILCVCHGSFLSPTEFVMHAGGKEVANPMKHIKVCSDSFCIKGGGFGSISTLVEEAKNP